MKIYCSYRPMIKIKVRDILRERGISQKELAKMTGIRESTISEICRGCRSGINLQHLATIAEALDISDISKLLDFE